MIEKIIHSYASAPGDPDLSRIVADTLTAQPDQADTASDFMTSEHELQTAFLQFVTPRRVSGSELVQVAQRTRRYLSRYVTYEPIPISTPPHRPRLHSIPFIEYPPVDTYSPAAPTTLQDRHQAVGLFITTLSPKRVLGHAAIARPWIRPSSRQIGLIKRLHPEILPPDVNESPPEHVRKQRVVSQILQDIIHIDNPLR